MIAHIEGEALTLATLWRVVRRDGTIFTFTDHDADIVYGGETYLAALGYSRSAIASGSELAVDEGELLGLLDAASIDPVELRAGLWDHASVRIFTVNWADLTQGEIKLRKGTLGEVVAVDDGSFRAELRGLAQPLQATVGSLYQPECRADLGDARCGIPLRPAVRANSTAYTASTAAVRGDFMRVNVSGGAIADTRDEGGAFFECTTSGTSAGADPGGWAVAAVGDTITDGSVVWTKRTAWTRPAEIDSVPDAVTLVLTGHDIETYTDGWFDGGVAIWETGDNAGVVREVLSWDQGSTTLVLFSPPPFTPAAGDVLRIQPGCDKTWQTCKAQFLNKLNFRGEPKVPGSPALMSTQG
jgi:hypothetical protein